MTLWGLRRSSAPVGGLGSRGRIDVAAVVRWLEERSGGWVDGVWTAPQIATARVVGRAFSVPESHAATVLERAWREQSAIVERVSLASGLVGYAAGLTATSPTRPFGEFVVAVAGAGYLAFIECKRRAAADGTSRAQWTGRYLDAAQKKACQGKVTLEMVKENQSMS